LERLLSIPTPEETETYKPVSHSELIDSVRSCMGNREFKETYHSVNEGNVMFGMFEITVPDNELKGCLKFINSYDKTHALSVNAGVQVKVCGNGMFLSLAENRYKKKHQDDVQIDYIEQISGIFGSLDNIIASHIDAKTRLKTQEMSIVEMKADLCEVAIKNKLALNNAAYQRVFEQINNPAYNYHNGNTEWDYYNHYTYVTRNIHPSKFNLNQRLLSNHFNLNI
jgi:hypothetical protein